jgi:serine/tyrosine/threonine adenylyltransferase
MAAGFVHGVMNTDNMNVTGETFDFGPYRFLPVSQPGFTAAYFDQNGLYAFGRQPEAALWNLKQLAGSFTLVASPESLSEALVSYETAYQTALRDAVFFQLGLTGNDLSDDLTFLQSLFGWMTDTQIPWHQFFFDWFCGRESAGRARTSPVSDTYATDAFGAVRDELLLRTPAKPERLAHAYFQQKTPQTLLIDEIEQLWSAISDQDNWQPLYKKIDAIGEKRKALLGEQG